MIAGGSDLPTMVQAAKPAIWRPQDSIGIPRVNLPTENAKYPETKHTMK